MYVLSDELLFRVEKNGGILINKNNFSRLELSKSESIFLSLVKPELLVDYLGMT